MTRLLQLAATIALLSVAWLAYRASIAADAVTRAATELPQSVLSIVQPALGIVDSRTAYLSDLAAVQLSQVTEIARKTEADANRQVVDALAIVKDAAVLTITEVQGLREQIKPTLASANAAIDSIPPAVASVKALTDDAKDSWDANYFDIQATIANLTVATAGIGRASDEVAKAAPQMAESTNQIAAGAAGVTADVHTFTSDLVKPKGFWAKTKAYLEAAGKVAARFL